MMKKIIMTLVAGVMTMAMLTGCGEAADTSADNSVEDVKMYADSSAFSGNDKYDEIAKTLTQAYAGTTDTDKLVYYVVNEDETRAILCMKENSAEKDPHAIMLIGDVTDNGDGTYTLLDVSTWEALTYKVSVTEEMGEEAYTITFNGLNDTASMFSANLDSVFEKISEF